MTEFRSKFIVDRAKGGFIVHDNDTIRIHVKVSNTGIFEVKKENPFVDGESYLVRSFPFYCYIDLLDNISVLCYDNWKPPKATKRSGVYYIIRYWAKTKTSKSLNRRIHPIWEELKNQVDPNYLEINRKAFSTFGTSLKDLSGPLVSFIKDASYYQIKDFLNYKAYRIAILYRSTDRRTKHNWMTVFGEPNTSLRRTLMNLPNGIPVQLLINGLPMISPLTEPITTKYKLYAACLLGVRFNEQKDIRVILRSKEEEIKESIQRYWLEFPGYGKVDFRKKTVRKILADIFDFSGSWDNLSFSGLTKRAIQYHKDATYRQHLLELEMERRRTLKKIKEEELNQQKTAKPKIKLPEDPEIKFLASYGEVVEEGKRMMHCVATYGQSAVDGKCFLFHVDYEGETATVEVNPRGYVVQSRGPHNEQNKATTFAANRLTQWAKGLI